MLLYLLFLQARNFVVLADDIDPSKSTPLFESANEQILYGCFMSYISSFETRKAFLSILEVIKNYISFQQKQYLETSIEEIKLIFATSILYKFRLGNFNIVMLDFAKEFDEYLVLHWNYICSHNFDFIKKSVKMRIAHYDYHIFLVNRSLSFLALVYATIAYEMVLFQVRQDRWRWTEGDPFEKQFDKLIHKSRKSLQFAFPKKDDNIKFFNIRFKDILTSKLNFQVMLDSLNKFDFTDIEIVCCFDKKTMLDVIVESATATAPVSSLEIDQRVCDVLYNNSNLMQLSTEVRQLIASGLIRNWSIFDRSLTRIEKFAMIEMSNSVDTFEEWKEILANADKASEEKSDAIDEWLDQISHFKN